jgi:hypothetical protein
LRETSPFVLGSNVGIDLSDPTTFARADPYTQMGSNPTATNVARKDFATFKFRATGWVTDASANYAYLLGCKFHEEGVTTSPDVLPIIVTGHVS